VIEIRDAVETDDAVLIELQKRCPMGSSLILQLDSSPSFFNRSKHQTENHVVVAVEDGNIVGSGSCAIMEKRVNEKILRTAYYYNLMVDPSHRRKGIAALLGDHREKIAVEQDCDLVFCQITEGNIPSIRLQEKRRKICQTMLTLDLQKKTTSHKSSPSSILPIMNMTSTNLSRLTSLVSS